jgi:hypothetical protein
MPDLLTQILALTGTVTGLCALWLQYRESRSDRPILVLHIDHKRRYTKDNPELHDYLRVILKNKGKQPIHILSVDIMLYPENIEISEQKYQVNEMRWHMYDARKNGLLKINPHERKEIIMEPCELLPKDLKTNLAIVEVTDALDQKYRGKIT